VTFLESISTRLLTASKVQDSHRLGPRNPQNSSDTRPRGLGDSSEMLTARRPNRDSHSSRNLFDSTTTWPLALGHTRRSHPDLHHWSLVQGLPLYRIRPSPFRTRQHTLVGLIQLPRYIYNRTLSRPPVSRNWWTRRENHRQKSISHHCQYCVPLDYPESEKLSCSARLSK
jgi:hypothetical protein